MTVAIQMNSRRVGATLDEFVAAMWNLTTDVEAFASTVDVKVLQKWHVTFVLGEDTIEQASTNLVTWH